VQQMRVARNSVQLRWVNEFHSSSDVWSPEN
jgi:hypothetical protein